MIGGVRRSDYPGMVAPSTADTPRSSRPADWIIDLGPEGGDKGGEIVTVGTPEQVAEEPRSYTGHYLKELLATSVRAESIAAPVKKKRGLAAAREREAAE